MTRIHAAAAAALCAILGLTASLPARAQEANARVIVQFKADSGLLRKQVQAAGERHASQALALGQRVGLALTAGAGVSDRSHVVFARGMSSQALADRLARESDVEFAVPVHRKRFVAVPNDPRYTTVAGNGPASGQWYLRTPSNTPGGVMAAINAEAAWDITTGSSSIVVAVLDTGITSHPDLNANVLPGYDMISEDAGGPLTANDGNGRDADASDPGDWITLQETSTPGGLFEGCSEDAAGNPVASDSSWHGTQTAGLIGALTANSIGMASVGRTVRILPVRVLGKCGGYDPDILAGMRWAAGISVPGVPDNPNPAKVINMSLGGGAACSPAYVAAVNEIVARGVTIVASAGNSAGGAVSEPASCNGVVGVAGLRHIGTKVGFSDLGTQISVSAPGGNCVNDTGACLYPILTTTDSGLTTPAGATYSDAFNISVGTSFSAPLVAGTAALMASVNAAIAPTDVRSLLRTTARPFPKTGAEAGTPVCTAPTATDQFECYCTTSTCGAGMLDARAAVAAAMGFIADIAATPTSPRVDVAMTLSGAGSTAAAGRTISSYTWSIADAGATGATLSATTGPNVSVTSSATGTFTVTLTLTDSSNATTSVTRAFDVTAAPSSGGGGGGGGAADPAWLLALLAAVGLLGRANRSGRRG